MSTQLINNYQAHASDIIATAQGPVLSTNQYLDLPFDDLVLRWYKVATGANANMQIRCKTGSKLVYWYESEEYGTGALANHFENGITIHDNAFTNIGGDAVAYDDSNMVTNLYLYADAKLYHCTLIGFNNSAIVTMVARRLIG